MFEYQQIVDHIRATLGATGPQVPDLCRSVLAEYNTAVETVNGRLRQCETRLKQGLRSEALQLCDAEPNLLDSVSALDFPEREVWCQLLSQHGIVLPPPLLVDVAGQLNEAYALEQPMAVLLRQHRLLAIARSPLAQRLGTLRGLAEVDAGNPVWRTDLQLFEKKRLSELAADVSAASSNGSEQALAALEQELSAKNWLTAPPETLLGQVQKARLRISQQRARSELAAIEEAFHQAQMDSDAAAGRRVRERWQATARRAGLSADDPDCQRVAGYLAWLAAEDQEEQAQAAHVTAVNDLELGLLNRVPASNLEYLYSLVEASGREIRPDLKERYLARLVSLEGSRRLRTRVLLASAAATVLLLLGAAGAIIWHFKHREEMAGHASALSGFIENKDLDEAAKYIEGLSPAKAEDSRIKELTLQIEGLRRDAKQREDEIKQLFDRMEEKGSETPDLETLERLRARQLDEANRLRLQKIEQGIIDQQRQAQLNRDKEFVKSVAELEGRFEQIESRSRGDLALGRKQLDSFQQELQTFGDGYRSRITPQVFDSLTPLSDRAKALKVKLDRRQEELVRITAMNNSLPDVAAYHKSLADFTALQPAGPRASELKRALAERESWEAVHDWNALVPFWSKSALAELNPGKAATLQEQTERVLQKCGDFSQASALRDSLPFVSALARRVDSTGARLEGALQTTFSSPVVADAWMVTEESGKKYYCAVQVKIDKQKLNNFKYYTSFVNPPTKTASIQGAKIDKCELSPQAKLTAVVRKSLAQIDDKNFDTTMLDILGAILVSKEMDPVLKFGLLRQTLEKGCAGSHCLQLALGEPFNTLRNAPVNPTANWLEPATDGEVEVQRNSAAKAIEEFQEAIRVKKVSRKTIEADVARFRDTSLGAYRWIGWLRRADDGGWQCEADTLPAASGKLFVAVMAGTGKQTRLESVGTLDKGTPRIDAAASTALVEGRPIYLELSPQ